MVTLRWEAKAPWLALNAAKSPAGPPPIIKSWLLFNLLGLFDDQMQLVELRIINR
jgi:hypothetical protein